MNWGYRVLTAYIAGVLFISFFVYKSMQVNIDLAEENYYEKELKFNDFAVSKKNGENLGNRVSINRSNTGLKIQFDSSLVPSLQKTKIHIYYPVNKKFDTFLLLGTPTPCLNIIDITKLHRGGCIIKITFELEGQPCYIEREVNI